VAYLRDSCGERRYVLCAYLDQLPRNSDEFLWPRDGVFRRAGGAPVLGDEAREIVIGTLRTYPLWQLANTAEHVGRQLLDLRIDSIMPATDPASLPGYPLRLYIEDLFPAAYGDYLASRQSTGRLPISELNIFLGALTLLSFAAGLLVAIASVRRADAAMVALALVIAAAWFGNAVITA